jgi:hypothetical protein
MTTEVQTRAEVRAADAALAWLNTFLATGDSEERPLLFKTLSIEFFAEGLQFVATNGHIMLRSWCPVVRDGADPADWPDIAEVPDRAIIVMDVDGFALGFMRTLLAVTKDEAHLGDLLTAEVGPAPDGDQTPLGGEFGTERLTLRACGQRIDLVLMEDTYPAWRGLQFGLPAGVVDGMSIAPKYLGVIGKLKQVSRVDCEFHGDTSKHISFTAKGETEVRGLLMPLRRGEVRE